MICYMVGDATNPICSGPKKIRIIPHICNSIGAWGAGFVKALSRKWPLVEEKYRELPEYKLGSTQFVRVEKDIIIANMIAQEGIGLQNGPPIRYEALKDSLLEVSKVANALESKGYEVSIHMPKIGTGLAGGDWNIIEPIINNIIKQAIYVYLLEMEINA